MRRITYGQRSKEARIKLKRLRGSVSGADLALLDEVIRSLRYKGLTQCPECGAGCKVHKHSLSANLVKGLVAFSKAAGKESAKLSDVLHERTLIDNFQKLKYFGLVVQAPSPVSNAKSKTGYWRVTTIGRKFLKGRVSVPKAAFTDRGIVVSLSEDSVFISELPDSVWETRPVYARNATPRGVVR